MRFLGTTGLCSLLWYTLIGLFRSRAALELRPSAELVRGEFPIHYDGNGGDDMWVDRAFFQNAIAKAAPEA
jgi:hypothetical protein